MEDSEDEETKILFMGFKTQAPNDELEVEGEVYIKYKIISSLEELDKCRKNNKQSRKSLLI